jgi:hypothetical protein
LTAVSPSAAGARRQFGRVRVATLRNAALWRLFSPLACAAVLLTHCFLTIWSLIILTCARARA